MLSSLLFTCLFIIIVICIPLITKSKISILIFSYILRSVGFVWFSIGMVLIISEIVCIIFNKLGLPSSTRNDHDVEYSTLDIIKIILVGAIIYCGGIYMY